jgi:hypothetical protein
MDTKKTFAVQFINSGALDRIFSQMKINNYTISDEDNTMAEVELTSDQEKTLTNHKDVIYFSEL